MGRGSQPISPLYLQAFHTAWRLSARGVATHTCANPIAPTLTLTLSLGELTLTLTLTLTRCARAKLSLGAAAMKREAWEEARTHLHDACEVRPHSSEAWYA